MGNLFKITSFLLLLSSPVMAESIKLLANSKKTLFQNKFHYDKLTDTFSLEIEKLELNNNSFLLIPSSFSDSKVKIKINDLSVKGQGFIVQTFDNKYEFLKKDFNLIDLYFDKKELIPRQPAYQDAKDMTEPPEEGGGDRGRDGNNGKDGVKGRNSILNLEIDANISRLDNLTVALIAQSGANGSRGGKAQQGSDALCDRNKGADGGRGGHGGIGGEPGNVGAITFKWRSLSPLLESGNSPVGLKVLQIPGARGHHAAAGAGGNGGASVTCEVLWQKVGKRSGGNPGQRGKHGWERINSKEVFYLGRIGNVEVINKDRE